jgi:hypothetical protein
LAKQGSGIDALLEALRQSGVEYEKGGNYVDAEVHEAGSRASSRPQGSKGSGARKPPNAPPNFSFAAQMASWGKKVLIIGGIILLVVILVAYWWFHPPINIHSTDTWTFVAIFILLPLFLVLYARSHAYRKGTAKVKVDDKKAKAFKGLSFIPVLIALVGILGAIASLSLFPGNAERYAAVLKTDTLDFAQDIKEVDYSEIPIIDRDSAAKLGNRAMGSIPEYVSQFEISPLYSQINYQGTPVRVSPLGYADIFKWFANKDAGIPAYVLVNMTTQDTQIVKQSSPIYYSQSEPLERNIDRHVQLKYPFYMFDQKSFEIDDEGHPWWICPVKDYTIGLFGGQTISRVILCDATTGECQDIPVAECPQWVDRVYPAELLIEQYNWSGAYKNGWLNSWLGQQGVVQTTPGTSGNLGYNYIAKDDDVWVYTGVTSATSDNSIVGFVLVNQRTAESHFYTVPGATEDSAMSSAEGQVQHLRYHATFPLLLNINGQPTYFMALKDDAGLVKMYAMLDIQRYQNVAVGDTVANCQKTYTQLLATNGVVGEGEGVADELRAKGVIATMATAVIDGNSHFYVKLQGDKSVYDFALPACIEIVGYSVGDPIEFNYIKADPLNIAREISSDTPVPPKPLSVEDSGPGAGATGSGPGAGATGDNSSGSAGGGGSTTAGSGTTAAGSSA